MKKALVVFIVLLLSAGLLMAAGCGGEEAADEETVVVDVDQPVSEGILGEFEADDGSSVSIYKDGTFVWMGPEAGQDMEGSYEVNEKKLTLTFGDGSTQTWSIAISNGKVAAVINPDGDQYTKK